MLKMPPAPARDVTSLWNWVEGNGCVARDETQWLEHRSDLCSVVRADDDALASLEPFVERLLSRIYGLFPKVRMQLSSLLCRSRLLYLYEKS